jgi:hypothetical protein
MPCLQELGLVLLHQTLNLAKLPRGKSGAARQGDIFEPEFGRSPRYLSSANA